MLNPIFCTHDKAMTKLYLFIYTLNKHNTFVVGKGIHNGKKQFTFETLLSFYLWAPRISYRPNYMTLLAYNVLKLTWKWVTLKLIIHDIHDGGPFYQFTSDDSIICLCMGMDRFDGELVILDVVWMAKKEGIVTRHYCHCTILKD